MVKNIEDRLRELLNRQLTGGEHAVQSLRQELGEVEKKIGNLLELAENGSVEGESVMNRLNELDSAKRRIQDQITQVAVQKPKTMVVEVGREVANFILNFEAHFAKSPMEERKLLAKKCISKIVIDREKK